MTIRAVAFSFLLAAPAVAASGPLPFSQPEWELSGDAAVETFDGRESLRLSTGWAYRRDVRLEDGTVDFDVRLTRRRSFVYFAFRMKDDLEYEELYVRPHKSQLPDAVQYAPVYQGQSAWQLYHGPGATAAVALEPDVWTHVRIVLQGKRAALFLSGSPTPALVIPELARTPWPGYIALRAFLPADTPGDGVIARFSNLVVQPGVVAVDLSKLLVAPAATESGVIRAWAISSAFTQASDGGPPTRPADATVGPYRRVDARASGLVELHRFVRLAEGTRELTASARVRIHAERPGRRALNLGFSDRATVFLNGEPLFQGEASYSYGGRREGLISYDQARLYLPLRGGENELMVVVADRFGGMGLMGRFDDVSGLTLEPR